jgi:hypothetical protein
MTEYEARQLAEQRAQEQPEHGWIPQQDPVTGQWSVAKIANAGRPRTPVGEATHPPPPAPHDDPRSANVRNIPPFGGGF